MTEYYNYQSSGLSFFDAIKLGFKRYVDFNGRSRRSEYWYFTLFNVLVSTFLQILTLLSIGLSEGPSSFSIVISCITSLYFLLVLLPSFAVNVRRLHDIGKSGFNLLWVLVPILGSILLIVWFCRDGDPHANQWGNDPKGRL